MVSDDWKGQKLLGKINVVTFMVLYGLMPFLMNLLRVPEGEELPEESLMLFTWIIIGVAFYLLVYSNIAQKIRNSMSRKYAGKRLMKGRIDLGGGKTENYKWLIKEMFPYDTLPKNIKMNVEKSEKEMVITCKECGLEINLAKFCPYCGCNSNKDDIKEKEEKKEVLIENEGSGPH